MIETIKRLERYVSYPTISSNPIVEFAADLAQGAEDLGFNVHLLHSSPSKVNVLATIGPQDDSLVLSGHMDVVPTDGQNWSGDPFKLRQLDNRLVARGSCDMKGFIASTMTTLSTVPLEKLKRGLTLIWTHDEEVGCLGAQQFIEQLQEHNYILPKSILIGEPTGMRYARMHGGHTSIEISIFGKAAHSSKPELGCSAISFAAALIGLINDLEQKWRNHPIHVEGTSCHPLIHVAHIEGGEAINIIPAQCTLKLGLRAMPSQDSRLLISEIQDRLDSLSQKAVWQQIHAELRVLQDAPPLHTCSGTHLENRLIAHGCHEGSPLPFSTDGGWFARAAAQPIVCGPGQISMAHQPDEHITIAELASCDVFLKKLIQEWIGTHLP